MEKRLLVAVVLSIIVLVGYQYFFAPKPHAPGPGPAREGPARVSEKPAPPVSAPAEPPAPLRPPAPAPRLGAGPAPLAAAPLALPVREVTVDTEKFRVVLSSAGAAPVSWALKEYKDKAGKDGKPLDLLAHQADLRARSLDQVPFAVYLAGEAMAPAYTTADHSLRLDAARPEAAVEFVGTDARGAQVTQRYTFHRADYRVGLDVTVRNTSHETLTTSLALHLQRPFPKEAIAQDTAPGYVALIDGTVHRAGFKKLERDALPRGTLRWFAIEEKYFLWSVVPTGGAGIALAAEKRGTDLLRQEGSFPPRTLAPGEARTARFTLFFGPKDVELLKTFHVELDKAVDFGWFDAIAKPLLVTMNFFHRYVGNYGVAIILLTVVIKILFFPLTAKSFHSMQKMQRLQPIVQQLREKYKDDRERLNREMMEVYRSHDVSPLGGCLPMLVQIPIFFALYKALLSSIELRHAPFLWWINDLSARDPFYVTPLLMGGSMFFQQKLTPTVGDPMQAKIMLFMPAIFTVMFVNFPSGLVIYWLVSNILSIGQQVYMNKKLKVEEERIARKVEARRKVKASS